MIQNKEILEFFKKCQNEAVGKIAGILIMLVVMWIYSYSWHLFPWVTGQEKWYDIPLTLTTTVLCGIPFFIGYVLSGAWKL